MTSYSTRAKPICTTNELNQSTQALSQHPVFANWQVIAKAWYFVAASESLKPGQARSYSLQGQRMVVFRGQDNRVRALDAFCPHMGADLSIGRVLDNQIQCFFHHWKYDGEGRCTDIPCSASGKDPRPQVKLKSYAIVEKYQSIWIWPDEVAGNDLSDFPSPMGDSPIVWFGKPILRTCHHHVCMINGLDPQHLKTVHNIAIEMDVSVSFELDEQVVDFILSGEFPDNLTGRCMKALFGPKYSYGMRYVNASVGLLTTMRGLKFRGKGFNWPESTMIFAYLPVMEGETLVQPIFLTRNRPGLLGWILNRLVLLTAYVGFYTLRDEDGAIYDNIRFNPRNLLPIDAPILQFINYVNKLKPSAWSSRSEAR